MARSAKPVDLQASHLTKEEYNNRKEQEQKLKGNDNLVYKPPKSLSKEGKKIYKFIVNELKASGILNNLDITILETCVDAILRIHECQRIIDLHGSVLINEENGNISRNPATAVYKDYVAIYNKCCMELGLSPSARSKLASINVQTKIDKEDPVKKAMEGSEDE